MGPPEPRNRIRHLTKDPKMKYIKQHKNFFDSEIFFEVVEYSNSLCTNGKNSFRTNYSWHKGIILDSNVILIHDIDTNNIIYHKIKNQVEKKLNIMNKSRIMIYFWTPGSHISWHNDGVHKGGLTIYINDYWNRNDGGLFLYEDNNEIKGIIPEKNLAIEQVGGVPHAVTCLTKNSPIRVTIQIFI